MNQILGQRVAILLAVYNGEEWLGDQLRSLQWQSHQDWHLFIRDDGSTDGSLEIVQRLGQEDQRIVVLPTDGIRAGSAAGNFMAALRQIDLAAFDHVAFCDQDDIWSPQKLTTALQQMKQQQAEGYSCDLIAFDNAKRYGRYIGKGAPQQPFDYLFQGASAGCTYVLSRKAAAIVIEELRNDKEELLGEMSHDWLIYAICRSQGLRWLHDPSAQVFYRQHDGNAYGASSRLAGLIKRLKMINSGWYRRQILWHGSVFARSSTEIEILDRIRRFSIFDRYWLAVRSRRFRRHFREALWLKLLFLTGLL